MSKEIEVRLMRLEERVATLQASAIRQAAAENALVKLLEEVAKHAGKTMFWNRQFLGAFHAISHDSQTRLLSALEKSDAALAREVRLELKQL